MTASAQTEEGKRFALVIGNDHYAVSPLKNAVSDARLITKALEEAGFKVTLKTDAKKVTMEEAVSEFVSQLGPEDTSLFYYAGHGVQIDNENLLVPVDFEAATNISLSKFRTFNFTLLTDMLKRQRHKRSIYILDACRSNPVSDKLTSGLAQPADLSTDAYVLFSTKANAVAADNPDGRNSPFSEALSDMISKPNLPIGDVFTGVTRRVSSETGGNQVPTLFGSQTTRFYFHPPAGGVDEDTDPTQVDRLMDEAKLKEQREDWDGAIATINRILGKKPGGTLEATAKAKLPYLTARKDAQTNFDTQNYGAAAQRYEQAYQMDPFSLNAAFQGVASNLLAEHLDEAVRLLHEIRVRGTSDDIKRADAMLKALAEVHPASGKELQAGLPQPPDVGEMFTGTHFGVPDFESARRYISSTPVDITKWQKEIASAAPPPPMAVLDPAHAVPGARQEVMPNLPPPDPKAFRVEVVSAGRNIAFKSTGGDTGYVLFDGPSGDTPVLVDGQVRARQVPYRLPLPAGKYVIRTMKDGQEIDKTEVEVKPLNTTNISVKK